MNEDFQRAKLQGTLGALCLLVGSAAYSIKGEIAYLDSQILVWIFAFTFLYHALKYTKYHGPAGLYNLQIRL